MSSYIEVRNVSKSFSGRAILQNISLSVEQGTTVGLVGANGSGKSVLFKIICGFEKPDQGSVYVRGRQIGKNGRDFPADMGVFINSPGFIGIYSGFQNLKFLADIQGKIGEKEIRQTMTKVGLDPDNKAKVDNYSLGMKQKLGLAQAIMEGQDKAALITLLITISFLFIFRNTTDLLLLVKLEHPNLPGIGQKIAAPPQLHFHFCHEHSPLIRLQPKIA